MRPHIRRWHARYRMAGGGAGEGLACVENGARARVAEAYEAAIARMFGDDPAVYVLRHVHTEMTLVNPTPADEAAIARRWAERAAASVVNAVTRRGDDAAAVMRFDDTADYVAHFLADLLDGVAWERWYYGAFSAYRSMSVEETIRRVLVDFCPHLAAILRRLAALGRWRAVLARIPPVAARELWRAAAGELTEEASVEQFRPFVRAAMSIAGALSLWTGAQPGESSVLADYCATAPSAPDWKQTRWLAEAVLAVLVFLARHDVVRAAPAADRARVAAALEEFEWLDREWLSAAIVGWFSQSRAEERPVTTRPSALTALQRRVIDVLRQLLDGGAVVLPDGGADSERDALALFAALAAAEPLLASHPAAPAMIAWFLRSGPETPLADVTKPSARAAAAPELQSRFAGVVLLTRALLDTRLPQLAAALGAAPAAAVILALTAEWTGRDDFDDALLFWSGFDGTAQEARAAIAALDPAACAALRDAVKRVLRDRAALMPSLAPDADSSLAADLVRLWAHWLPRLGHSSVPWLLRQFVLRRGILRVERKELAVGLAPANLDVILDMAGYLRPVAAVPWLGDRRITFEIDRSLA